MHYFDISKEEFGFLKYICSGVGIWPYTNRTIRFLYCSILAIVVLSLHFVPEFLAIWVYRYDKQVFLDCFAPFIIVMWTLTKFAVNLYYRKTIKNLIDEAKFNLQNCRTKEEYDILQHYSEMGNTLALGWAGVVYSGTFSYILEPLTPVALNFMFNYNNTNPLELTVPYYFYGVDTDKHYYKFVTHISFFIIMVMSVTIASDSIFIVLVVYVTGLFAATGHMMSHIPTKEDMKNGTLPFDIDSSLTLENIQYMYFVYCIKKHKEAIEYAKTLETVYVWCFGVVVVSNVPLMSITAMQITLNTTTTQKFIKYIVFGCGQTLHLFFDCALSQKLIDFSTKIQESVTTGLWYDAPKRVQKLIVLVALRSQLSSKLTAGKILVLSLETFTTFVKTAGSYFTVLASMQ